MKSITIRPSGFYANISPHAFQYYARDFYNAYTNHKGGRKFSPARLFLLSRSIELAAKALHLAQGSAAKKLSHINHDLELVCDQQILSAYGITQTYTELFELKKANKYYKGKGFEYFLFRFPGVAIERTGPQQALSGWPDLPEESILEGLLDRLLTPKLL
jgi:hypothetical protein